MSASRSSSPPTPMPFDQAINISSDILREHVQKCNKAFTDAQDGHPVAVFTGVTEANIEKAFQLHEDNSVNSSIGFRVDVDNISHKLCIIETVTEVHEVLRGSIDMEICEFRTESGLKYQYFIRNIGRAKHNNMEADGRMERINLTNPADLWQTTLVVEVGWSQLLGTSRLKTEAERLSLLGKANRWIENANVPLVLAVKIYGYVENHAPGMLVFLVNEASGVHEVYQAGTIPDDEVDLLNAFNARRGLAAPPAPIGITQNASLEINGRIILGLGTTDDNADGELRGALQRLQDLPQEQIRDIEKEYMIAGVNTLLGRRNRNESYGVVKIDLNSLYKNAQSCYYRWLRNGQA